MTGRIVSVDIADVVRIYHAEGTKTIAAAEILRAFGPTEKVEGLIQRDVRGLVADDVSRGEGLPRQLRELANVLEESGTDKEWRVTIHSYSAGDLQTLRRRAAIMENTVAQNSNGHHWLDGTVCGLEATAHYAPGLLGSTRMEKVVVMENEPDLSLLKKEST